MSQEKRQYLEEGAVAASGTGRDAPKTNQLPQYAATIIVDILHFIYGLSIGWSSIALPALMDPGGPTGGGANNTLVSNVTGNGTGVFADDVVTEEPRLQITLEQGSWLTSIFYICAMPSMPIYGMICEKYGRKACGYLIGVPFVVSAVVLALATSFAGIQASRALLGVAAGGIFVFAPLYVSEIVEDAIRGRLGAFVTLMRNVGILFAYVLGMFLSYKGFEYVAIAPPVIYVVCFYFLPETPLHLLRQNKPDEAEKALRWLRGSRADVRGELQRMQASLAAMGSEGAASATLCDLFGDRVARKAFLIAIPLSCNQQFCGFFGVVSYTFIIFQEASPTFRDVSNVIVGSMLVVGIGVSMIIYDKVRRKVLLLVSDAIMISALFILSIYFYLKDHGRDVSEFSWLPVTALSFYVIGYGVGLAALPIVILTEIFTPKIRNIGLTYNGVFTWFIIFIITKTFPSMSEKIGFHGSCWFYIAWCIMGVVAILTILPETKNRSLESILHEIEHGKNKNRANMEIEAKVEEFVPLRDKVKKDNQENSVL